MVNLRPRPYHMIIPTLEERHILNLGTVPRRSVGRQTLQHQQRAHIGTRQHSRVGPHTLPVGTIESHRIRMTIYRPVIGHSHKSRMKHPGHSRIESTRVGHIVKLHLDHIGHRPGHIDRIGIYHRKKRIALPAPDTRQRQHTQYNHRYDSDHK